MIGPWSATCSPAAEVFSIADPPKILVDTRREGGCASTGERVRTTQLDVPVLGLPADRYEVEVHAQTAEGEVAVYAASSVLVVDRRQPRILALELEEDLDRNSHRLAVEVEIPIFVSSGDCATWEVRPVHAWVHGRDLYAELEVEQVAARCPIRVTTEKFQIPLPELEAGLYRILAQRREAGGVVATSADGPWAQSPRLVEARRLVERIAGRFEVTLDWRDSTGHSGRARLARGSQPGSGAGQSAIFSFFDDDNWEVLVKVLDGCAINDHHWVFASASTDLEYVLTIEDGETGASVSYRNELGQASPAITDTTALATCE